MKSSVGASRYEPVGDIFYLGFGVVESEEVAPGVSVEFDEDGNIVGIELSAIHRRLEEAIRWYSKRAGDADSSR